ncbi:MAG: hypothetical protein WKF79_00425 [Nocardioides sp.]
MSILSYATPSPFPPSFGDNLWAYGVGLFGDVVAAALSLSLLLTFAFEHRRHKAVKRILHLPALRVVTGHRHWSPLFIYRAMIMSMLSAIVLRTLPDAVLMLAWGEVSESTIRLLLTADLIADGLALIPLGVMLLCWATGRQVLPQLLIRDLRAGVTGAPPWDTIWKNGRIILVVLVIAIGVTVGKASA